MQFWLHRVYEYSMLLRVSHHTSDTLGFNAMDCAILEAIPRIQRCSISAGIDIRRDLVPVCLLAAVGHQHRPSPSTTVFRECA